MLFLSVRAQNYFNFPIEAYREAQKTLLGCFPLLRAMYKFSMSFWEQSFTSLAGISSIARRNCSSENINGAGSGLVMESEAKFTLHSLETKNILILVSLIRLRQKKKTSSGFDCRLKS